MPKDFSFGLFEGLLFETQETSSADQGSPVADKHGERSKVNKQKSPQAKGKPEDFFFLSFSVF